MKTCEFMKSALRAFFCDDSDNCLITLGIAEQESFDITYEVLEGNKTCLLDPTKALFIGVQLSLITGSNAIGPMHKSTSFQA